MAASSLESFLPEFVDNALMQGWDLKPDLVTALLEKLRNCGLVRVRDLRRGLPEADERRRRELQSLVGEAFKDLPDIVTEGYVELLVAVANAARTRFSKDACQSVLGSNAMPMTSRILDGNIIQTFPGEIRPASSSCGASSW